MSDVYAVFGTLLALGIAFPGLVFTWWLLFPGPAGRAEARLAHTPGRTFSFGLLLTLIVAVLVLVLANGPLPGANVGGGGRWRGRADKLGGAALECAIHSGSFAGGGFHTRCGCA